jgi:DNA-binding NarL/FixJ family response regulator
VRVVVADDSMLTREGIVHLLGEAGVDVVAQAADADRLLDEVRLHRPDVAVVDIKMPPTHTEEGLDAAQRIRDEHAKSECSCCPSTSSRATPCVCSRPIR